MVYQPSEIVQARTKFCTDEMQQFRLCSTIKLYLVRAEPYQKGSAHSIQV